MFFTIQRIHDFSFKVGMVIRFTIIYENNLLNKTGLMGSVIYIYI